MNLRLLFIALFWLNQVVVAQYKIEVLDSNTFFKSKEISINKLSFRGLSVVTDSVIWVSGSRGTIAKSVDGGENFFLNQIAGYEKSDFRDIEAFDENNAIIMSSGTPAVILKTTNGGQTWKEIFRQNDNAYFLDAMDFWDEKNGVIVGDPINNHFVILKTNDGGETWQELDTNQSPKAMLGEAIFAASGTSLRCWSYKDKRNFSFVTGGMVSRLITFGPEQNIYFEKIPITQGNNASGAFSLALGFNNTDYDGLMAIVGGNYAVDTLVANNSIWFRPIVKQFFKSNFTYDVKGYRSCVERINGTTAIACGTSGVDYCNLIETPKGYINFSKESFHVVKKAKKGNAVFFAGQNGKIGKLVY